MASTWPTINEALQYMGKPSGSVASERLTGVFNASIEAVAADTQLDSTAGTTIPAYVREGVLLLMSRLYERHKTPTGVQGFLGDQTTYILRNDPDVQALVGRAFDNWAIG